MHMCRTILMKIYKHTGTWHGMQTGKTTHAISSSKRLY